MIEAIIFIVGVAVLNALLPDRGNPKLVPPKSKGTFSVPSYK